MQVFKDLDRNQKQWKIKEISPGGGMVDAVDSKSAVSNGVRVQVPPGVQKRFGNFTNLFFFWEKRSKIFLHKINENVVQDNWGYSNSTLENLYQEPK